MTLPHLSYSLLKHLLVFAVRRLDTLGDQEGLEQIMEWLERGDSQPR
jgi:hypothetical protein